MAETKKSFDLVDLLNRSQPYEELNYLEDPELSELDTDNDILRRIQGSLVGLAIGDALGASVEFRPHSYMIDNPVSDMQDGGTWGLQAGQWTDDTSMALCLAASLIGKGDFNGYDQLVRYKWWYRNGYMSSTGKCFDIGASTRQAIHEFENRQKQSVKILQKNFNTKFPEQSSFDQIIEEKLSQINFDVQCGALDAAGNGPLMRLTPIPLFYYLSESHAIQNGGSSARFTHGDKRVIDTCRYYSALIWNAINGLSKTDLLDSQFFLRHFQTPLHKEVMKVVEGSYKTKPRGYDDGIRGKGFIINSLEAALWAFYNDENSFEKGVLLSVNLGDDTDTTAAIYGQLAGAVYGIDAIPQHWREKLFQINFILTLANGLFVKGKKFNRQKRKTNHLVNDIEDDNRTKKMTNTDFYNRKPVIISEDD